MEGAGDWEMWTLFLATTLDSVNCFLHNRQKVLRCLFDIALEALGSLSLPNILALSKSVFPRQCLKH